MTDVKQGRSSRPKPNPKVAQELKARTPSQLAAYLSPAAKRADRLARIAQLEAETALCEWCNDPMWRADHTACAKALAKLPAEAVAHDAHVEALQQPTPPTVPAMWTAPSVEWAEQVDAGDESWPGRRQTKVAQELAEGDIVLDEASGLWRSILIVEADEQVIAETTRYDGDAWVTLTWPLDAVVTWRRA